MSRKRGAEKQLTRDDVESGNLDEDVTDDGKFAAAAPEVLKKRKIVRVGARRARTPAASASGGDDGGDEKAKPNVFAGFSLTAAAGKDKPTGFGFGANTPTTALFGKPSSAFGGAQLDADAKEEAPKPTLKLNKPSFGLPSTTDVSGGGGAAAAEDNGGKPASSTASTPSTGGNQSAKASPKFSFGTGSSFGSFGAKAGGAQTPPKTGFTFGGFGKKSAAVTSAPTTPVDADADQTSDAKKESPSPSTNAAVGGDEAKKEVGGDSATAAAPKFKFAATSSGADSSSSKPKFSFGTKSSFGVVGAAKSPGAADGDDGGAGADEKKSAEKPKPSFAAAFGNNSASRASPIFKFGSKSSSDSVTGAADATKSATSPAETKAAAPSASAAATASSVVVPSASSDSLKASTSSAGGEAGSGDFVLKDGETLAHEVKARAFIMKEGKPEVVGLGMLRIIGRQDKAPYATLTTVGAVTRVLLTAEVRADFKAETVDNKPKIVRATLVSADGIQTVLFQVKTPALADKLVDALNNPAVAGAAAAPVKKESGGADEKVSDDKASDNAEAADKPKAEAADKPKAVDKPEGSVEDAKVASSAPTAAASAVSASATEKWTCASCGGENDGGANQCNDCLSKRPAPKKDDATASAAVASDSATAGWTCAACTADNDATAAQCKDCFSKRPAGGGGGAAKPAVKQAAPKSMFKFGAPSTGGTVKFGVTSSSPKSSSDAGGAKKFTFGAATTASSADPATSSSPSSKPVFKFGAKTAAATATGDSTAKSEPAAATISAVPKFKFGAQKAPATGTVASASAPAVAKVAFGFGKKADASAGSGKTAAPAFGFGAATKKSDVSTDAAATVSKPPSGFKFGTGAGVTPKTSDSVGAAAGDANTWKCPSCTCVNESGAKQCKDCFSKAPASAAAVAAGTTSKAPAVTGGNTWTCSGCDASNEEAAKRCKSCLQARDGDDNAEAKAIAAEASSGPIKKRAESATPSAPLVPLTFELEDGETLELESKNVKRFQHDGERWYAASKGPLKFIVNRAAKRARLVFRGNGKNLVLLINGLSKVTRPKAHLYRFVAKDAVTDETETAVFNISSVEDKKDVLDTIKGFISELRREAATAASAVGDAAESRKRKASEALDNGDDALKSKTSSATTGVAAGSATVTAPDNKRVRLLQEERSSAVSPPRAASAAKSKALKAKQAQSKAMGAAALRRSSGEDASNGAAATTTTGGGESKKRAATDDGTEGAVTKRARVEASTDSSTYEELTVPDDAETRRAHARDVEQLLRLVNGVHDNDRDTVAELVKKWHALNEPLLDYVRKKRVLSHDFERFLKVVAPDSLLRVCAVPSKHDNVHLSTFVEILQDYLGRLKK